MKKISKSLVLLFILAFAFFYFTGGKNIQTLVTNKPIAKIVPASQFNGWIAWWDEKNALASLQKNPSKYVSVSPVWYKIDTAGKLQKISHTIKPDIKLIPAITNDFDPKRVSGIINNSDTARGLIEELANIATIENYQGYDIDWEEIDPKDQAQFTIYIQNLAGYLHTYNLTVQVSVHAQTGESSDRAVAKGYNLAELAKSADSIKIMAYDFHNKDTSPGAITPFNELKKVLKYSAEQIPAEKIILGLPTYGYDWEDTQGKPAEAVSFKQAQDRIKQNNGQVIRDKESNSLTGNYVLGNKKHTIWFEDALTLNKMVELARSFGIYQFSFWRLGTEDPNFQVY